MKRITEWNKETSELYELSCQYAGETINDCYKKPSQQKVAIWERAQREYIASGSDYTSRTFTVSFMTNDGYKRESKESYTELIVIGNDTNIAQDETFKNFMYSIKIGFPLAKFAVKNNTTVVTTGTGITAYYYTKPGFIKLMKSEGTDNQWEISQLKSVEIIAKPFYKIMVIWKEDSPVYNVYLVTDNLEAVRIDIFNRASVTINNILNQYREYDSTFIDINAVSRHYLSEVTLWSEVDLKEWNIIQL